MKSPTRSVVGFRSSNIIVVDLSHTLLVFHTMFRIGCDWLIIHWDDQSCIRLQIEAGICAVPTADAVATGEVYCYNCIFQLRSSPRFAETISHGYSSAAQRPLTLIVCPHSSKTFRSRCGDDNFRYTFN